MAINFDQLIEQVKRVLGAGNVSPNVWAQSEIDLAAIKNLACESVAHRIALDIDRRGMLQQDYSVALNGAGVGDLLAAVGSITGGTDIIWGSVVLGNIRDADNNNLVLIPNLDDFYRPASPLWAYYHLGGQKIQTRALAIAVNSAADVVTVNGPLTIRANFESTDLAFWPSELNNELAAEIATLALTKFASPANA